MRNTYTKRYRVLRTPADGVGNPYFISREACVAGLKVHKRSDPSARAQHLVNGEWEDMLFGASR